MYITLCGDCNKLHNCKNVLQLNFYCHIFVTVLLQSFGTVPENFYCEQFYEQSWGVVLLPGLQKTTRFCPNFQPSSYTCIGLIGAKIRYMFSTFLFHYVHYHDYIKYAMISAVVENTAYFYSWKKFTKINLPTADFLYFVCISIINNKQRKIYFSSFPVAVMIIQNVENLHIFQKVKMSQIHDLFALTRDR